ncbi:SprT-like domain-containing protein [Catenovulum sediminis]|uniref:SprT-like domain-containing protein n=1 Tax=Catenovulum sediminis TaxID=1740262 RepID=A0ABV1RDF9_9ALTE|nr:SprT-like domain-containing protein [Catenovulum sediminis]
MQNLTEKKAQIVSFFTQLQTQHSKHLPELSAYQLKFSQTKRQLGSCHYRDKIIRISEHVLQHNGIEMQLDTLKHEFAHAIAFHKHGERGHGSRWKYWALQLGATPASRAQEAVKTEYNYRLVKYAQGELVPLKRFYHRKVALKNRYIPNDPNSLNCLFLVSTQALEQYLKGEIKLNELEFHQ